MPKPSHPTSASRGRHRGGATFEQIALVSLASAVALAVVPFGGSVADRLVGAGVDGSTASEPTAPGEGDGSPSMAAHTREPRSGWEARPPGPPVGLTDGMGGDEEGSDEPGGARTNHGDVDCADGPVHHAEALRGAMGAGRDHLARDDFERLAHDPATDPALRRAALFFLANPALRHVLERGGEPGDDNDRIGRDDLETGIAALRRLDWSAFRTGASMEGTSELTAEEAQQLLDRLRIVADVAAGRGSIDGHVSHDDYRALATQNVCFGDGVRALVEWVVENLPEEEAPCAGLGCIGDWVGNRWGELTEDRFALFGWGASALSMLHHGANTGMDWLAARADAFEEWTNDLPGAVRWIAAPIGRVSSFSADLAAGFVDASFGIVEGLYQVGAFAARLALGDPDAHQALTSFVRAVADDPSMVGDIAYEVGRYFVSTVRACAAGDGRSCGELGPDVLLFVATGGVGKAVTLPSRLAQHLPRRLTVVPSRASSTWARSGNRAGHRVADVADEARLADEASLADDVARFGSVEAASRARLPAPVRDWMELEQVLLSRTSKHFRGDELVFQAHAFRPEAGNVFALKSYWIDADDLHVFTADSLTRHLDESLFRTVDGQRQARLFVHPESETFYASFIQGAERADDFFATPTASGRTLLVWRPGQESTPFFAKVSLDRRIDSLDRTRVLPEAEVTRSVGISRILAREEGLPDSFHLLPEVVGVMPRSMRDGGMIIREIPQSILTGRERFAPLFSLYATPPGGGAPMLARMVEASGMTTTDFVRMRIVRPFAEQWAALTRRGITNEPHAQNVLIKIGDDGLVTGEFLHRDLGGFVVDFDYRAAHGHAPPPADLPIIRDRTSEYFDNLHDLTLVNVDRHFGDGFLYNLDQQVPAWIRDGFVPEQTLTRGEFERMLGEELTRAGARRLPGTGDLSP